ncbi:diguanylate cyclase (GGDEF) domain-containing protein [Frankia sp. EI5c]|nr:diguanylate cyclase (GGDEF) domain-containing protein [Frankia sp. EI5c]
MRWRTLVDRLPVAVVIVASRTDRILYVNDCAVGFLGRPRRELRGETLAGLLAPAPRPGTPLGYEDDSPGSGRAVLIRRPDGSTVPALETAFQHGRRAGVHMLEDERSGQRLRRQIQTIFSHSPVSLALIDRTGKLALGGGGDMPAVSEGLARASHMSMLDAFADESEGLDLLRFALAGHPVSQTINAYGGSYDLTLTPVTDESGQVAQVVASGLNSTARERSRSRTTDLAYIAHEALKTTDSAVLWTLAVDTLACGLRAHVSVWDVLDEPTLVCAAASGTPLDPPVELGRQLAAGGVPLDGVLSDGVAGGGRPDGRTAVDGWYTITAAVGPAEHPERLILAQRPASDENAAFSPDDEQHIQAIADVLGSALTRLAAEQQLLHSSRHDGLTGLINRVAMIRHLRLVVNRGVLEGRRTGVIFVDLDGFKAVNDTYGHKAGDAVLRAVADRLRDAVRSEDVVARLGGDEFAVVCSDVPGSAEVEGVANRIVDRVAEPIPAGGATLAVTASVGVAISGSGVTGPDRLLNAADIAMYAAKRGGGGRCVVYEPWMRINSHSRAEPAGPPAPGGSP